MTGLVSHPEQLLHWIKVKGGDATPTIPDNMVVRLKQYTVDVFLSETPFTEEYARFTTRVPLNLSMCKNEL